MWYFMMIDFISHIKILISKFFHMYGIFHSRFKLLFVTLIIILVYSLNRICMPFIVKKLEGGNHAVSPHWRAPYTQFSSFTGDTNTIEDIDNVMDSIKDSKEFIQDKIQDNLNE